MKPIPLTYADAVPLLLYVVAILFVGWHLRRRMVSTDAFLLAGRSLPSWVTGIAFVAANCGALEVMGVVSTSAKYGARANHFYWVGAIPAMLFLALFMMPIYHRSRVRSVPEFLKMRFGEKTRAFNAACFAVLMVLVSGISLYAMAIVLGSVLGWSFTTSVLAGAGVVLVYVFLGGLRATIYNEVLQFVLIVVGFAPLSFLALREFHGFSGLGAALPDAAPAHLEGNAGGRSHDRDDGWLRDGDRPRLRALLRLLVHRLPARPACPRGEGPARRGRDAAHRLRGQALLPVPGRRAGPRRLRPLPGRAQRALRPRPPAAHAPLLRPRPPRPGHHRHARELHVRHGRKRHRLQHGLDLRPLPGLRGPRPLRPALPRDRARGDGGGRRSRLWHRHHRPALQQPDGLRPAAVLVLQRSTLRDVPPRDVHEVGDAGRGAGRARGGDPRAHSATTWRSARGSSSTAAT